MGGLSKKKKYMMIDDDANAFLLHVISSGGFIYLFNFIFLILCYACACVD